METGRSKPVSAQAKEWGKAIKLLRERKGMTQDQAAERRGVTRTAWQNYESGRAVVLRMDMQQGLAEAMGASRPDLLECLREIQRAPSAPPPGMEELGAPYIGFGRQQAIFPLTAGDVMITYPANLAAADFQELSEYLALFLRRAKSPQTP